jgi:hypothetical protein
VIAAGLAIAVGVLLERPQPSFRVAGWTQLTHDERVKVLDSPLVTDGKCVIFSGASKLAVSAALLA